MTSASNDQKKRMSLASIELLVNSRTG